MGQLVYLKNVVNLSFDAEKCTGCGMCLVVCPHQVFTRTNGKAQLVRRDACMECGACAKNCPAEAIAVTPGVGCAQAVINSMLGKTDSSCCCVLPEGAGTASGPSGSCDSPKEKITCC